MRIDNDYWHSLDKQTDRRIDTSPNYLGISAPPFKDQLEGLKSRIFQGASRIELGFTGKGKGNMQGGQTTPGMFGKDEREAMRQLAKINEVELSTHSTFSGGSLAGFNAQAGGFQDEAREQTLHEIKRAVDFAADTAGGGPVVVHAEDFPRETLQYKEFQGYPGEENKAPILLADKETGQITQLPRDTKITVLDENYMEKVDGKNVPKVDEEGRFHWQTKTVKDLYEEKMKSGLSSDEAKRGIYGDFVEKEVTQYKGEERRWSLQARQYRDQQSEILKLKKQYNGLIEQGADKDTVKHLIADKLTDGAPRGIDIQEIKNDPLKYIEETSKKLTNEAESYEEISQSYGRRAHDMQGQINRIRPIEEIGVKKSSDTISRAALEAYTIEKQRDLKKPLFIAPEALWNEAGYGGHPKELKQLIISSRRDMVEKLTKKEIDNTPNPYYNPNVSNKNAEKIAEDHIKATFDIGHANTWRKFFKAEPGETIDKTDKRFKDWLLKEVQDLQDQKLIGHVHIADNFGFHDEHTPPGEGNAPIPEFIKKLKETGYKGAMIVEPAHQDVNAWTTAMRNLQSPMYRINAATSTWTDIEGSYFGSTASPAYIVGAYAPDATLSEEHRDWRFWSGTTIE